MDPLAAWKELLDALTEMDWERVLETAENLLDWITKGGFPPEVIMLAGDAQKRLTRNVYGPELNRSMVDAACRFAIQLAKDRLKNALQNSDHGGFRLSCIECDIDSPVTFEEAIESGWTRMHPVPEGPAENFLGLCPDCRNLTETSR